MPKKTKVTWNGRVYPTIAAATEALGVTKQTMLNYIRLGYSCDDDLDKRWPGTVVIWNETEYQSLSAAARALNISREAMRMRIKNGYTCDADMRPRRQTHTR